MAFGRDKKNYKQKRNAIPARFGAFFFVRFRLGVYFPKEQTRTATTTMDPHTFDYERARSFGFAFAFFFFVFLFRFPRRSPAVAKAIESKAHTWISERAPKCIDRLSKSLG